MTNCFRYPLEILRLVRTWRRYARTMATLVAIFALGSVAGSF
jgi:uncharacterized protein YjiS (DUF1127 family)